MDAIAMVLSGPWFHDCWASWLSVQQQSQGQLMLHAGYFPCAFPDSLLYPSPHCFLPWEPNLCGMHSSFLLPFSFQLGLANKEHHLEINGRKESKVKVIIPSLQGCCQVAVVQALGHRPFQVALSTQHLFQILVIALSLHLSVWGHVQPPTITFPDYCTTPCGFPICCLFESLHVVPLLNSPPVTNL